MMKRWLGVAALGTLLMQGGCGDVESCKETDDGCLRGSADDSGNCKFGLVANAAGRCVEPKDRDSAPAPNNDVTVAAVCDRPSNAVARKQAPLPCRPAAGMSYTFAEAAEAACSVECARRAQICGTDCDPAVDCAPVRALAFVAPRCPAAGGNVECVMAACEQERDKACAQQECPVGSTRQCSNYVCDNDCKDASIDFTNDGICDDGDLVWAMSAACPWGSDCNDCGPRTDPGKKPAGLYGFGEFCVDSLQCGVEYEDFTQSIGWCVDVAPGGALQRCLPDCTSDAKPCPSGFTCTALGKLGADEAVDRNMVRARYCKPSACAYQ